MHEVGEGLNSELHPLAEVRVGKISQFQFVLSVERGLLLESRDSVVIETGPRIFPTFEMRHPVGNINVNTIDAGSRDLPKTLHVNLAPFHSVGSDPHVFVSFLDLELCSPTQNRLLSFTITLHTVRR